jgi:hypothetical protein
MDPASVTQPRALLFIFAALVFVAAVLVFATGPRQLAPEQPVVITRETGPRQAEAEAASAACLAAARDAGCIIWVLDRTRDRSEMPALAREYARLAAP